MRKTRLTTWCSAVLVLGLAGCNAERTDDTLSDATPEMPAPDPDMPPADMPSGADAGMAAASLKIASGAFGAYLADNFHRALYTLAGDTDGSKCTAACLAAWPPLLAPQGAPMGAAPALQAGLVGTIRRADGSTQVTFNGHPLYHYAKDTSPGGTSGQGIDDEWGEWYLVTPDGAALENVATAEEGT